MGKKRKGEDGEEAWLEVYENISRTVLNAV
jgi:hypothetical protein